MLEIIVSNQFKRDLKNISKRKYNLELLDKSKQLMKREHYVLKQPIIDLHFEDITELNHLPSTPFEASSISSRKLDNYGRLTTDNRHYYYLSPSLAYEKVQVKYLPEQLEIYYEDGRYDTKREQIHKIRKASAHTKNSNTP